jgi:DNA-binding NarL/FixJ family response regulator
MTRCVSVDLIEDDPRFRDSVRLLIDGSPGFRCAAAWRSVEAALQAPELESVDLVLLDLQLPGVDGAEGVGLLIERVPSLLVLMFSAHDDDRVFASLCRGACGYLLKSTSPARLLEAIREAVDGGSPMSPSIARRVVRLLGKTAPQPVTEQPLTPRELQLLAALGDGHSYQSAAGSLGVTVNTVRCYIRSIYQKLHVHTQTEAVSKVLRAGLI